MAAVALFATACGGEDESTGGERADACAELREFAAELSGGYPVPLPGGAAALLDRFDAPPKIRTARALVAKAEAQQDAELRKKGIEPGKGLHGYSVEELEEIVKVTATATDAVVDASLRIDSWIEATCARVIGEVVPRRLTCRKSASDNRGHRDLETRL